MTYTMALSLKCYAQHCCCSDAVQHLQMRRLQLRAPVSAYLPPYTTTPKHPNHRPHVCFQLRHSSTSSLHPRSTCPPPPGRQSLDSALLPLLLLAGLFACHLVPPSPLINLQLC